MSNLKSIGTRTMPTHIVQAPSNTLSKEARKSIGAAANYVPRVKAEGEALVRDNDWRKGKPYRTGDGDYTVQAVRPGSMDAYALPSRGNRT